MLERIEGFITREIEARRIPGAAIAVVRPGEPVWSRGFGLARIETGEPFTPGTPFSIQSVTKTFVAAAIMQLQEKGMLSVDDPVAKHLPGVVQNEWEAAKPVLIRHLLTHSSGLPVDAASPPVETPRTLGQFVRLVARTVRPPETDIVYANWGYDTIGLLIEELSGLAWFECIDEHICGRLGLRQTTGSAPAGAATGHYLSAVDGDLHPMAPPHWNIEGGSPGGAIFSSVEDLARFATAHLEDGGEILGRASAAQMHAVSAEEPGGGGMALGFRATRSNGRRLLCHGGDGAGFTNFLGLYPDDGIAVVLTLNRGGVQAARSVIANTVLGLTTSVKKPRRRVSAALPRPGVYTSNFWDIEIALEREGEEPTTKPLSGLVVTDGPEPTRLMATEEGTFAGDGGMFHGFDVTVSDDGSVYGCPYPYRFERTGELPAAPPPLDAGDNVLGTWRGAVRTPMGPLAITFEVTDPATVAVSTPFAQGMPVEGASARNGRLSGRFPITVPGVGDLELFPRLEVRGGSLTGPIITRGMFGEIQMEAVAERV
jgi:CubicO group peptidase (beta-lactamase class C family)